MKLDHFVQKMKKNTLKDGLDAKKDEKTLEEISTQNGRPKMN